MKRMLPSLREKKRYIVFEAQGTDALKRIERALQEFLGTLGMSKVNPVLLKDKWDGKQGILRINHAFKDEVIVALSLAKAQVINVSGILKKAERRT